jgi:hypothetical protein
MQNSEMSEMTLLLSLYIFHTNFAVNNASFDL